MCGGSLTCATKMEEVSFIIVKEISTMKKQLLSSKINLDLDCVYKNYLNCTNIRWQQEINIELRLRADTLS